MDQQFAQWVLPFFACIPRMAAIFIVLPLFGPKTVRGIVRNEFILVMALFVTPMAMAQGAPLPDSFVFALLLAKEAIVGVLIGFFLGMMFWIAQNVGYLMDLQTGSQNSSVFDPVTEHEEGPTSSFLLQFVIALVLAGGGLMTLLEVVFDSYATWPVLQALPSLPRSAADLVAGRMDTLFSVTVRFAAPIIVLLALIELGLGLMNRFAEGFDVYNLAMPVKGIVAFFVLLVFLSFVYDSLAGLLRADNEALRLLGDAMRGDGG